ncbi:vitamin B12 ABC transporter substrate-binding protein BtuF [Enterovibrio nigricans]|uniref:Vitamin B12-binding protein n=1 Tax=Enterovibrio nigricans DSM 22720 TaxID=1121868 RepID=A0A1T4TTH2_9GAMM|nr:vitamin B12 ABC transporter substrate-binding protein BtuF [Enterovibrio nigricans]PKF51936.1 vitamin B12 ABC transporter substrate-binding protein BtuF [Enterovibrio nigricans]SKA43775.1 vitamin B12 transport system substrate-binding protein [Enterovibrio nigricans DSM 22720]
MFRFLVLLFCLPTLAVAAPLRVISLSPHTTELAYEAGLGDNLVAVSAHSDYPPEALSLEQVANYRGINIERVVTLKPDLVLAWKGGNPDKELAKLERLGIEVFYSNPHSLYEAADNIEKLGKWSDDPEKAKQRADAIRSALKNIETTQQGKPEVPYFYQLSDTPLLTNNANHWPQPLFNLCGGKNIFGNSAAPYPQISVEQVVVRKPQVMFYPNTQSRPDALWLKWADYIPAVKNEHIYAITGDWLNRPTPRALKAVDQICAAMDKVRSDLGH